MEKKVALHNLGCKVNAYELEAMEQMLKNAGYEIVPFAHGADIYIINTLTGTNMADRKSRQMLHRAKKLNPECVVVAAGCYVQVAADADGSQPVTTVDGEGATGLDLVEVFCDATDIARKYQQGETEVTIPLNTYIAMLKTRGSAELENYGKNINFVSTINTNSNLKFKADFDLGDRITCKETKWGIQIDARITEVAETYQKGEETIEATFGDSLPTLVDQIRKVR